jgi:flagellar motility protein MotE (MotC chaperone)
MRRLFLPSLLLLVTFAVGAKVGLSYMQRTEVRTVMVEQAPTTVDVVNDMAADSTEVVMGLGDHLIPSAEAAASMAIAEESFDAPAERELLESLRATREKLTTMEKSLNEREQEAAAAEDKAAERIAELEKLEARIQELLLQEESIKSKKIKRLTAVYEGMKAESAAPVIAQMELATVVKMFLSMNEKQVGKILSFLPPEKAVTISHALTQQISQVEK